MYVKLSAEYSSKYVYLIKCSSQLSKCFRFTVIQNEEKIISRLKLIVLLLNFVELR